MERMRETEKKCNISWICRTHLSREIRHSNSQISDCACAALYSATLMTVVQLPFDVREVIFYRGGGLLKIGLGSGTLSKIKRGIKRFFQIKKGDHLYFLKK